MSRWETLSYKLRDGSTDHISRFISGDKDETKAIDEIGNNTHFHGNRCIISHDVIEAYMIRLSDTTDMGTIRQLWTDNEIPVCRHNDSLYTFETDFQGPKMKTKEDKLEELPDWVKVSGNWQHLDQEGDQ